MGENELLIRHAQRWAEAKNRALNPGLLQLVLDVASMDDDEPANRWPLGRVEHLALLRWPSHGPQQPPDPNEFVSTLDTFFRFLRATGRLASGSATPAELTKEARRVAPQMAELCANPAQHGIAKSLVSFGHSIGIDLDEVDSIDALQQRLDAITEAWNALPDAERRHRMRLPSIDGDLRDKLSRGDREVAAQEAREAPFTQACVDLAEWVGTGRFVTGTGALRLAEAKKAYAALRLSDWLRERDSLVRRDIVTHTPLSPPPFDQSDTYAGWAWRSAHDCPPLTRLWEAASGAQLIEIGKTKARATGRPGPDEDWLHVGLGLMLGLCLHAPRTVFDSLTGLLLLAGTSPEPWLPIDAARHWWAEVRAAEIAGPREDQQISRTLIDLWHTEVDTTITEFRDTGIWVRHGDTLRLTDFGREFAGVLFIGIDQGIFDPSLFDDDYC